MSEPVKRYSYGYHDDGFGGRHLGLIEKDGGDLVLYDDYARLEQECERLRDDCVQLNKRRENLALRVMAVESERDAALKQAEGLRELLTAWRRMFDGGICSGSLGTLCDQTDSALSAKP